MARARSIKPGFFKNEELVDIDPFGRLLFIGLWMMADREGRLDDRPKKIKMEIFPCDNCDIDSLLTQLNEKGFILRYEANGEKYIQIINFSKHQKPHMNEKASEIPAPFEENNEEIPEKEDTTQEIESTIREKVASAPEKAIVTLAESPFSESLSSDSLNPHPPLPDSQVVDVEEDAREAQKALALVMYNCDTLRSGFEMQEVNRWLNEFPTEVVMEAIRKIGLSGGEVKRPMTVIDRQLWEWRGKGLTTLDAIRSTYVSDRPAMQKKETQRERVERLMQERERRQASG